MRLTKKRLYNTALVLAVIILIFTIFTIARKIEQRMYRGEVTIDDITIPEQNGEIYYDSKWYTKNRDIETLLIIGADTFDGVDKTSSVQADFNALLVIDNKNEKIDILHLNRDIMTDIKIKGDLGKYVGTEKRQLALSYAYGDRVSERAANTKWAIQNLLYDTEIDNYICLNMDRVKDVNDLVGGVTVTVNEDMTNVDASFTKGNTITLKGKQALSFVRARMSVGDGTNLLRMERQKSYMYAFVKKLQSSLESDSEFAYRAVEELIDYITTDYTVQELLKLADEKDQYDIGEIITLSGDVNYDNTFVEYYPDENALRKTVIDLFYVEKQ